VIATGLRAGNKSREKSFGLIIGNDCLNAGSWLSLRGIERLLRGKHRPSAIEIAYSLFFYKVNLAAKYGLEFIFHIDKIVQAPCGIFFKTQQNIDIAVRPEILAKYRPKQRKLSNFPLHAKSPDFLHGNVNSGPGHAIHG
jgi:hypothetical protein